MPSPHRPVKDGTNRKISRRAVSGILAPRCDASLSSFCVAFGLCFANAADSLLLGFVLLDMADVEVVVD